MEGYSVTEAASVLGVPTERVWELLARGVLSGVPDGETGMRVFLQPRPVPPAVDEPRRSNGGSSGREPEAEASPFRELLSEFRNLTERYGQALLALGESRGEVASLRSRVDLLEARFDLRLPMSGASTAQPDPAPGWNTRQPAPAPTVEPIKAEDVVAAEAEPSAPRRTRRGQHRATDDFAEALARAEDPSPAELPGGEEAAAAFAALRDEAAHRTADHADAALPRELPAAEPIAIIEPDEIAEVAPQPVAEAEVAAEEAPEHIGTETVDAETEPIIEGLAAAAVEAEAIVDLAPDRIEKPVEPPTPEPEPTAEAPAVEAEDQDATVQPIADEPVARAIEEAWEPVAAVPTLEAETVDAEPQPVVEQAAAPGAEIDAEPVPEPIDGDQQPGAVGPDSAFDGLLLESDPEAAEPWFEPEPAAESELAAGAEPPFALQADEEPEEADEAEPSSESEDAAQPGPGLETEVASEPPVEAGPEDGLADAEPSWDRDRYTARIEEPDWIPEERSPQSAATTSPEAEARVADDREPASAEPPWVGEPGRSTPTGEETMLWFGREPNRAAAAWPTEDDSAAEMEQASTGGHATRPQPITDEPIAFRPALAAPPADLPDVRAEYRASLRPQPPSPASRAYRRLRRIFPG